MESSDNSGYVKEPLLIFVSWQQHLALAPHEESNFNMLQHAMEEDVQHQQVEDAPVGVVEADIGKEQDECVYPAAAV
jgi:hypothetical protein